jgi:adenosylmethionine-8-amino-7-oxononanoate aminotransferase
VAATVAREVLRILEGESLVEASAAKGERLKALLHARLGEHPAVGDIRGRGLMVGVELVRDRGSRAPFPRAAKLTEAVVRIAREAGLLLYSGTGNANGVDGDTILLGPPFVVTDAELARIADGLGDALDAALVGVGMAAG